jgi:periplasmic protein TonB
MVGPLVLAILMAHPFSALPLAGLASTTGRPAGSAAQVTPQKPWPPAGVARPGAGVVSPRLIKDVKPNYTAAAMAAKIAGLVSMEVVVQADGTVGEVRVKRSLDREFGLDNEAVRAVKRWRFAPGSKDGVAVPVLVEVEMTFSLRK